MQVWIIKFWWCKVQHSNYDWNYIIYWNRQRVDTVFTIHVCMCLCVWVQACPSTCMKITRQPWLSVFTFYFTVLISAECSKWDACELLGLSCLYHRSTGITVLLSGFMWISRIQTQALMFAWQVLYPMRYLPRLPLLLFETGSCYRLPLSWYETPASASQALEL